MSESTLTKKTWGPKSFIPLLTFLAVYLGAGLIFSLMGVENPFKQISREFAVLCGLCTVLLLSRGKKEIDDNVDLVAKHCGEPGVMLMIMIFALAGAFSRCGKGHGRYGIGGELRPFYHSPSICICRRFRYFLCSGTGYGNLNGYDCRDWPNCAGHCGRGIFKPRHWQLPRLLAAVCSVTTSL